MILIYSNKEIIRDLITHSWTVFIGEYHTPLTLVRLSETSRNTINNLVKYM